MALQRYTGAHGYLLHCAIVGNTRIGLDGKPSGAAVTEAQARGARTVIERRRARKADAPRTVNANHHDGRGLSASDSAAMPTGDEAAPSAARDDAIARS